MAKIGFVAQLITRSHQIEGILKLKKVNPNEALK